MNILMRLKTTFRYARVSLTLALLVCLCLALPARLAAASQTIKPTATAPSETATVSFENALAVERSDLADMEQGLERWEVLKEHTITDIDAYHAQNAAHEDLLLVLNTRIDIIQTALNNNRLANKSLSGRIEEFQKIGVMASDWIAQLSDRISIAEKRMTELRQSEMAEADSRKTREKLNALLTILYEKKKRGEIFQRNYTELFDQLKHATADLAETGQQLESRLQLQEKSKLFERHPRPFANVRINRLMSEVRTTWYRTSGFLDANFWQQHWRNVQRSGGITQAIFLALFLSAVIARKKTGRFLHSIEDRLESGRLSFRRLALILLRRSYLWVCAAIVLWLYDLLKLPHINYHLARFLNQTVFTLLLARWGIDFLKYRSSDSTPGPSLFIQKRFVKLFRTLRVLVIIHLLWLNAVGSESVSNWLFRLAFETFLLAWGISFWRAFDSVIANAIRRGEDAPPNAFRVAARIWTYMVFGGALLMDIIGYHALSAHWLVSWTATLALVLWAHLSWQSIQEWHRSQQVMSPAHKDESLPMVAAPVGWLMVQMARLLLLSALLAGVLMAWTGSDYMLAAFERLFKLDFSVGSLSVSVKGILLAVIIFYVTRVATRIGKRFLAEKVLDARDFERGLKDSIVTISGYIIWGVGILLALGVLGVNATSLAVVFGALSIGIGFGLQNIFNNFISGLILLFERPIQVGDYVEVNGLWAEVKKINVRSTIVQTFDNATVIIPNSDFISQQVTNWSFKDPRMRRHVDVGVAYGSDVELVRSTLLDISDHIPQILKYPKPDVLFLDHGDSALIFRLRYWAHVDSYHSTSTAVRFELDRRFRDLAIEIAFPQRDLHIRSGLACPFSGGQEPDQTGLPIEGND